MYPQKRVFCEARFRRPCQLGQSGFLVQIQSVVWFYDTLQAARGKVRLAAKKAMDGVQKKCSIGKV